MPARLALYDIPELSEFLLRRHLQNFTDPLSEKQLRFAVLLSRDELSYMSEGGVGGTQGGRDAGGGDVGSG